jgi:hypothetical protein
VLWASNLAATRRLDGDRSAHHQLKESAMTTSSHIHRIVLIAVLGCAILAAWTSAAVARPIDTGLQYSQPDASIVEPPAGSDWILPVALGGVVMLVAAGTAGHVYRARTRRRAIA